MSPPGRSPSAGVAARRATACPAPSKWHKTKKARWIKATVTLYGKRVELWYQTIDALWYPSAGQQLLRIVVVRDPSRRRRDDCFFSLDRTLTATQILEIFSRRWPLEVCFRDVKQFLGFEDPQNRVAKATTRTAPLIFFIYDLVLLWHAQSGHRLAPKSTLDRLWYPQKTSVSFEDILRTLRHATWQERIFNDPALDAHTRKILQPYCGMEGNRVRRRLPKAGVEVINPGCVRPESRQQGRPRRAANRLRAVGAVKDDAA